MKLFAIAGGVHPAGRKERAAGERIRRLPLPPQLLLPMRQHIGIAAEPTVRAGTRVLKGQLIGLCAGGYMCKSGITAPVHAPTSGTIETVDMLPSPHPSGLPELMVALVPDGREEWAERMPRLDPQQASPDELAARIHQAGIVGLGGATFPAAAKLDARKRFPLHTLILNGAECEPYLTADDRLMREGAGNIVDGALILKRILGVPRVIVAIEDNKTEALKAMRMAAGVDPAIRIVAVPTRYPMGSEKHLIKALTGKEVPAGRLPAALGIIVNNVGTAYAAHDAVRFGQPLISRIVTVSGGAVRRPGNFEVLLGTPIAWLFEQCGGFGEPPAQLLTGGPMMGQPLPALDVPVVKGTNGVLALTRAETDPAPHRPCIRCGACVGACPCGLQPFEMAQLIRAERLDAATAAGLPDCILCGSCAYVCPSHIPLSQFFNYGKGRLMDLRNEQAHAAELKRLADEREARVRKAEEEKKAKQAARKQAASKEQGADA